MKKTLSKKDELEFIEFCFNNENKPSPIKWTIPEGDVTKLCRCGNIKYKTEDKCRFCFLEDRIDSLEERIEKHSERPHNSGGPAR